METERRVVDNRVFLLGLDDLYRDAMKQQERGELLLCARAAARALSVAPADVPVEGYYYEDAELTEYFRLVRALQGVSATRETELKNVAPYLRLKQVTRSPIFGPPNDGRYLLSLGEDVLSVALDRTFPDWSVESLTQVAYETAIESDDYSLVALAALARDSVVLAALRESVVLYAMLGGCALRSEPEYVWAVDPVVEERAIQFVRAFNHLFSETLPQPSDENAESFWHAGQGASVRGRCVRLGFDPLSVPTRQYHWAIDHDKEHKLIVKEFWDTEIWTTQRYLKKFELPN